MALSSLRLRRALTSLSSLHRTILAASSPAPPLRTPIPAFAPATSQPLKILILHSRAFSSPSVSLSGSRSSNRPDGEIGPDDILFEGCDYKHWLFVIDFPKDPIPTPAEMVAKYEEICAKGLNISIEEAKTKIYACSTTTYQGFQAVMSEEEAEKFNNIPGVIFVLPDSYLYPETKEYGGDKYVNGHITPRTLPHQHKKPGPRPYGRHGEGGRVGPMPNPQPSQDYGPPGPGGRRGPMQNYRPPQNYGLTGYEDGRRPMPNQRPPQDYDPAGRVDGRRPMPNYRPSQDYDPSEQGQRVAPVLNHGPPQNYGLPGPGGRRGTAPNFDAPQNYGPPGPGGRRGTSPNFEAPQNYGPPGPGDRRGTAPDFEAPQGYGQPGQGYGRGPWPNQEVSQSYGQPGQIEGREPMPTHQGAYNHQQPGNYPHEQGYRPQREQRGYVPPGSRDFSGDNWNYAPRQGGYNGRGPSAHGQERNGPQAYPGYDDGQMFSQVEQRDLEREDRNYTPTGQTVTNQRRY